MGPAKDSYGPLVDALARFRFAADGEGLTTWDALPEVERAKHMRAARAVLQVVESAGYLISRARDSARVALSPGDQPSMTLREHREEAERFLRSGEPLLA